MRSCLPVNSNYFRKIKSSCVVVFFLNWDSFRSLVLQQMHFPNSLARAPPSAESYIVSVSAHKSIHLSSTCPAANWRATYEEDICKQKTRFQGLTSRMCSCTKDRYLIFPEPFYGALSHKLSHLSSYLKLEKQMFSSFPRWGRKREGGNWLDQGHTAGRS